MRIENALNLIFSHLNINSIRNKFRDFQQVISDSVDILKIAETKIDSSFPTAQFYLPNYHQTYCQEISGKSPGILIYIKSNLSICQMNSGNLCKIHFLNVFGNYIIITDFKLESNNITSWNKILPGQ